MSSNQPVARVRIYPISASIWKNQSSNGETFYSVTLQRTYKDDSGKYQHTDNLNVSDLLIAAKVLDLAHTQAIKLRAADHAAKSLPQGGDDDQIPY